MILITRLILHHAAGIWSEGAICWAAANIGLTRNRISRRRTTRRTMTTTTFTRALYVSFVQRAIPLLGAGLLCFLAIFIGFCLFFVVGLFVVVTLYLTVPVLVLEPSLPSSSSSPQRRQQERPLLLPQPDNHWIQSAVGDTWLRRNDDDDCYCCTLSPLDGMWRSLQLTQGHIPFVFTCHVILLLIQSLVAHVVNSIVLTTGQHGGAAAGSSSGTYGHLFSVWGTLTGMLPSLLFVPAFCIMKTVLYIQLRVEKEGLTPNQLQHEMQQQGEWQQQPIQIQQQQQGDDSDIQLLLVDDNDNDNDDNNHQVMVERGI